MKMKSTKGLVAALALAVCLLCTQAAIAPIAYAAGASPTMSQASTAYSLQFTDAHGHVALKAHVVANTGVVRNFRAGKDVPYVKEVVSGQPITPASLGVVKTGVWGSLLPAKHDLVAVSIQVATLKSMSEIRDPSISSQSIQLPEVVGETLSETVHLPAGARVSIPIGLHGAGGTLTIARMGILRGNRAHAEQESSNG